MCKSTGEAQVCDEYHGNIPHMNTCVSSKTGLLFTRTWLIITDLLSDKESLSLTSPARGMFAYLLIHSYVQIHQHCYSFKAQTNFLISFLRTLFSSLRYPCDFSLFLGTLKDPFASWELIGHRLSGWFYSCHKKNKQSPRSPPGCTWLTAGHEWEKHKEMVSFGMSINGCNKTFVPLTCKPHSGTGTLYLHSNQH